MSDNNKEREDKISDILNWYDKKRIEKKYITKRYPWKDKERDKGKNRNYSVIEELKEQYDLDDEFMINLTKVSLENLIALKLELASKSFGGKLFGIPIIFSLPEIVEEAIIKYAYGATTSVREAQSFLGLKTSVFYKKLNKYRIGEFFEDEGEKS